MTPIDESASVNCFEFVCEFLSKKVLMPCSTTLLVLMNIDKYDNSLLTSGHASAALDANAADPVAIFAHKESLSL